MKKLIFLILALWSLNTFGMKVGEEESAAQEEPAAKDICHIDLIPHELVVIILEQVVCDYFSSESEPIDNCLGYHDTMCCPRKIYRKNIFHKIMNLLINIKLVCKRFDRCADNLIRNSTLEKFHNGRTPLILFLSKRNYDLAKYFLEHGANPNVCDINGRSPLMVAIKHCKSFEELFKSGLLDLMLEQLDVNAKDKNGRTALGEAIFMDDSGAIVALLIKQGARLNDLMVGGYICLGHRKSQQRTPLGWAVCCGKKEVVRILLENGADINGQYKKSGKSIVQRSNEFNLWFPGFQNRIADFVIYFLKYFKFQQTPDVCIVMEMIKAKDNENHNLGGAHFCILF